MNKKLNIKNGFLTLYFNLQENYENIILIALYIQAKPTKLTELISNIKKG